MGYGPLHLGARAKDAVRAAMNAPLTRIKGRGQWRSACGQRFHSTNITGALDKGALDYDPFTDCIVATEKGRAAVEAQ